MLLPVRSIKGYPTQYYLHCSKMLKLNDMLYYLLFTTGKDKSPVTAPSIQKYYVMWNTDLPVLFKNAKNVGDIIPPVLLKTIPRHEKRAIAFTVLKTLRYGQPVIFCTIQKF